MWKKLAEMTLLSIMIFNRRRPREIETTLIADFNNRNHMNDKSTRKLFQSLSEAGKGAVQKYHQICIRGKRGRIVPVLLLQCMIDSIQFIIDTRMQAKVSEKNIYVFGIHSYNKSKMSCPG